MTRQQLEEHDKMLKKIMLDECVRELEYRQQKHDKEIWAQVDEEWKKREQLFMTGDCAGDIGVIIQLLAYLAVEILIEKFGWIVPKKQDPRSKILRFADAYADKIGEILSNEKIDIRETNRRFTEKYGLEFLQQLEE